MSDLNPEVLTDVERLAVQQAVQRLTMHRAASGPTDLSSVLNPVEVEVARLLTIARADERVRTLTDAAVALSKQPAKTRAQYVATLRLYAAEPWRLAEGDDL